MRSFLILFAVAAMAGCGYKGPLYLPETNSAAAKTGSSPVSEPAPGRPMPSEAAPAPK